LRKNLRRARLNKDLSKKELAEKVGISERMYGYLESGESEGSIAVWQKLSDILGETINNLIIREEKEDNK
jgi:transcriptional regulator with XRE-family HTH domain